MQNDVTGRVIVKFDEIEYHLQTFYQMQSLGLGLGLQYPRKFCPFLPYSRHLVEHRRINLTYSICIGNYTVREVLMKNRSRVWRNVYINIFRQTQVRFFINASRTSVISY